MDDVAEDPAQFMMQYKSAASAAGVELHSPSVAVQLSWAVISQPHCSIGLTLVCMKAE